MRVFAAALRAIAAHLIKTESAVAGFRHVRALVAVENDDCVVTQTELIEPLQDAAHAVVERFDIGQVAAHPVVDVTAALAHVVKLGAHLHGEVSGGDFQVCPALHQGLPGIDRMVWNVTPDVDIKRPALVFIDELNGGVVDARITSAFIRRLLFLSAGWLLFVASDDIDAIGPGFLVRTDVPFAKVARGVTLFFQ
jgi:hypothetical protein